MQPLRGTLVDRVMTLGAETIGPRDTLEHAAQRMRDRGVGLLPVVAGERLLGVITDRDIVVRAVGSGSDPKTSTVQESMTSQVFHCFVDEDLIDAAHEMQERAVRRLVVLDRKHKLVGVLSVDDVARLLGEEALAGEIVSRVVEPTPPDRG
jgi:CBS domain-containing protein